MLRLLVKLQLYDRYHAAKIVVWVEDTLTREYLRAVWDNPTDVAFFIAGGSEQIPRIVFAARRATRPIQHVFGIIDRDFNNSNHAKWSNATTDCFYLLRHELENYLLDAEALTDVIHNNRKRAIVDIEQEIQRIAAQQPAWLACRDVMKQVRQSAIQGLPEAPTILAIPDHATAINYITTSSWFTTIAARLTTTLTTAEIANLVQSAIANYSLDLTNGNWAISFSGKEIFRQIRSYVYQPPQNPGEPDIDVAKSIGRWQLQNNRVPSDLTDLLTALRARVAII